MPYISSSGTPAPTGPDAYTPPAQLKALVDAEDDFNYYTTRPTTTDRDNIAAPQLREGLLCYVEADDTLYQWDGSTWSVLVPLTNRQLDTTNSTVRTITQIGIGKITGNGTGQVTEAVTFPVAFKSGTTPSVTISYAGFRSTGAFNPAGVTGGLSASAAGAPSATGFTAYISPLSGTLSSGLDFYYSWSAVGEAA